MGTLEQATTSGALISAHRRERRRPLSFGDIICPLVGLLGTIEIRFTGTLLVGDLLFLIILAWLIPRRGKKLLETRLSMLIILAGVWLLSQITTDLVRNADPEDYLRGWAKIVSFAINMAAVYLYIKNDRRVLLYTAGLAVGLAARYFYHLTPEYEVDPWKWAFGWPTTVWLVILATLVYRKDKVILPIGILLLASFLNLYFNFRSQSFFCVATACCLMLSKRTKKPSAIQLISIAAAMWAALTLFSSVYSYAAESGYLGDRAREKYDDQTRGDMNMLLSGRSESLASIQAVLDSPIIGHGSWAKDPQYVELQRAALAEHGYRVRGRPTELIPSHSHLMGSWVDAGILGTAFWVYVLSITIKGLLSLTYRPENLKPLSIFFAITLLWDILFSPFGGDRPIITPIYILLMLNATRQRPPSPRSRTTIRQMPSHVGEASN